MTFPPVPSAASELELPTGTCVDLQFSGCGIDTDFFDPSRSDGSPLSVIFSPSGDVWKVQHGQQIEWPHGRLHFLVGQAKVAIDSGDGTPNRVLAGSNLGETINYWISVSTQTGLVQTASVASVNTALTPADPNYWPTVIEGARAEALSFSTKGGR